MRSGGGMAPQVMKLYVVFSSLEIFDKLCSSFGQDILEALYASASSHARGWRGEMALDLLVAYGYLTAHTLVLFYQAVALSVAINSNSNVLLTLLISNNFTELKTNVFKRCEAENLFQVSCADAVERFNLSMYLLIVLVQFVFVQKEELTAARLHEVSHAFLMICVCEIMVDWIKHAFVTKFNRMRPDVYAKFTRILCADTAASATTQEPLANVAARMGFVPLPLFCLAIRVFGNEALPTLAITVPGKALHVHAYQLTLRSSRPSRSTTRRARCCCCSPGSSSARSSCSSPSPCSASPLSTSSGRAEARRSRKRPRR
uniref:Uncharacterized protein n=1 Tax=Emiliania huxleyi TaxID=2903 RepID=A0A7S3T3N3_EMIHU